MAQRIDKEILEGFVDEAKGYLPLIPEGLERFRRDPSSAGRYRRRSA